ncbi:MAG: Recombination protein RecR [Parcubacteria group bacterium GW2011_GWC1_45_9]|nr:MAG: Recombination protein RecR [Parcubacteria group bacterium GW2011_GWA1_Parcubacteria_45_10]KKT88498.1 MAG: Recombination protein RecR [Parcubacteria group bacterium GW2011_GWB1_45_10]KKU17259.1 MAG: Recombination protein RecR [Parcubacteria group bacterium GW2011_GWC1_45_9]
MALKDLADKVSVCKQCFFVFDPSASSGQEQPTTCSICRNPNRDKTTLAVVEKETDLISIEKTKKYPGLYFVLGGLFSSTGRNGHEIRLKELSQRIQNDKNLGEVILALSHTAEGDLTAMELEKIFNQFKHLKITRLGLGLPRGAEVEFADEDTLANAIQSRR